VRLSEQELVDCTTTVYGCNGGDYPQAWDQAKKTGGLVKESDYPYKASDGVCDSKSGVTRSIPPVGSYPNPKKQADIVARLKYGPLAVAVVANNKFSSYKSGIFSGPCPNAFNQLNHAIILVGYKPNSKPNKKDGYYIVQNSWGTSWGEKGFIRLALGNTCGVEADVKGVNV